MPVVTFFGGAFLLGMFFIVDFSHFPIEFAIVSVVLKRWVLHLVEPFLLIGMASSSRTPASSFFLRRSIAVTIILSLLLLLLLFQFYFCASLTIPHFWMSAFFHYHLKYKWFDCSRYFNLISAFVPFPNICVLICIRSACNTTCIQVKRIYLDSQYILETWQRTVKHFMLYVYW